MKGQGSQRVATGYAGNNDIRQLDETPAANTLFSSATAKAERLWYRCVGSNLGDPGCRLAKGV